MRLRVDDGQVVFATHIVHVDLNLNDEVIRRKLPPLQMEEGCVVVYSDEELQSITAVLEELGIRYTIEQQVLEPANVAKAEGVKYASCSEAIDHILNDKAPESLAQSRLYEQINALQQDNEALRNRVKIYEDALLGLIFKGFKGAL